MYKIVLRTILGVALFLSAIENAQAQSRGDGYLATPLPMGRGVEGLYGLQGGGDAHVFRSVGIGAESGLVFTSGYLAPYVVAHLPTKKTVASPFISGAYFFLRDLDQGDTYSGPGIGGGVDLWFRKKTGLRVELQHVTFRNNGGSGSDSGIWLKVGVVFR